MVKKFNIAIIGPGRHADLRLAPALKLSSSAQLWSVCSRDISRATTFAKKHTAQSKKPAYTDLNLLLEDPDLDAVLISSPDKLHFDQVITSIKAGKHCLVEKPLATDVNSCLEMLEASKEYKVCLAVAYHLRWHQGHRLIHKEVQAGKIGKIRHVRAQWTWQAEDGKNWRASSDVGRWWSLGGVGTHCLDLIRWIMLETCGEVKKVNALTSSSVWDSPHDETAILALKFDSGATAEICSSVLFESPSSLEIYGDNGYFICTDTFGYTGSGNIKSNLGDFKFDILNPLVGEIDDFVRASRGDVEPEVDAKEGLENVKILSRIN